MSEIKNVVQIKRGPGKPANGTLYPYELGYDTTNGYIYIGDNAASPVAQMIRAGKADAADKLSTARSIRVNLASTSSASFNGTEDITPGVNGTLPIANGGTNATDAASARANLGFNLSNLGVTATAAELNVLDGITATTAELNVLDGVTATAAELNRMDGITASTKELNHCKGVTSAIQTQLNNKQASITGAATTITSSNLTKSRALISSSSGKVAVSAVTSTELGHLAGVTDAIQTQLNGKISNLTLLVSNFALTSTNTTIDVTDAGYKAFVVMGHMDKLTSSVTERGYVSLVIPSDMINVGSSKALAFSLAGAADAKLFCVYKSSTSSTATITFKNLDYYGSGVADNSMRIYGLK